MSSIMYVIDTLFKLKNEFLAVQRLRGMSGWSWDDARHKVTAPDDVWDAHIAVRDPWVFSQEYGYLLFSTNMPGMLETRMQL